MHFTDWTKLLSFDKDESTMIISNAHTYYNLLIITQSIYLLNKYYWYILEYTRIVLIIMRFNCSFNKVFKCNYKNLNEISFF